MLFEPHGLPASLDRLEAFHGPQQHHWPVDPYEFLIWWHCGYPASDAACARGWDALTRSVGVEPDRILAASQARLAVAMREGGMVPEVRAECLQQIAERTRNEFGGDLRAALVALGSKARKTLKTFHGIADPGADRILLFARVAPVAAVPSNGPHVLVRLLSGKEPQNYGAVYRQAQSAIAAAVPAQFHSRRRAFLLLKVHGQEICKAVRPKCESCPVRGACAYFAELEGGSGKAS